MAIHLTPNSRIFISFWLFGLINNVLYVVILSAAIDLVGVLVPKATVLLADVIPSLAIKMAAPFFIHIIPYSTRITMLILLSFSGMVLVALSGGIPMKLVGIIIASLSSGLGELSFLQMTHFYGELSISAFSSGTGGAGLVGSFLYLMLTTWFKLSVTATLLFFSVVPVTFWLAFYCILPPASTAGAHLTSLKGSSTMEYQQLENSDDSEIAQTVIEQGSSSILEQDEEANEPDLAKTQQTRLNNMATQKATIEPFSVTLKRLQPFLVPYMAPLFLVYISEYIINQGISPTLLFPIEEMPFSKYRDAYVTYGTLYQLGVFISRSSASFIRIRRVYIPSVLQFVNLVICIYQAIYGFIPNVYLMMILFFYEGLLGGAAYVNTFMKVAEETPPQDREFAMGSVGVSDSAGVVCAGLVSLWLEKALCGYQKSQGIPYCELP